MKKVSRKQLLVLAVILIGFSIYAIPGLVFRSGTGEGRPSSVTYYCPMHPNYVSGHPGDCPICNMKLVPRPAAAGKKERKILYYRHPMGQPDISPVPKKDAMGMDYVPVYEDEVLGKGSLVAGHATVEIPVAKQQLIGVKLGTAEKQKLVKEIRAAGRVAYDPELFSAQQEYLSAAQSAKKMEQDQGPYPEVLERGKALLESSKMRLRLLGMTEKEIEELETNASRDKSLVLPTSSRALQSEANQSQIGIASALSGMPPRNDSIWVYANIYEYEIPWVKVGSAVTIRIATFPDREFSGEVRALDPVLDPATRSIRLRARVENSEGLLRPEMYVDVYLKSETEEVLAVPTEAVMPTGEQNIIFVSHGEGYFEPRDVKLGAKTEKFYEVKSGLQAGEQVAVSGNFLIDSESRLQGALQGMTTGEHQHGE